MTTLPDVSKLNATEVTELKAQCTQRLDALRRQHMEEAELLGLTCALPADKPRKPRTSGKHTEQEND